MQPNLGAASGLVLDHVLRRQGGLEMQRTTGNRNVRFAAGMSVALVLTLGAVVPMTARADVSMGVIGDSYSESYLMHSDRTASQSWSDQIGGHGVETKVNLGTIGYRPEPVAYGYSRVWAYGGANTQTALDNQVDGLAKQIAKGAVQTAVIAIGLNDIGGAAVYDQYTSQAALRSALDARVNNITNNINAIVDRLQSASVHGRTVRLVIGNIPDATATPEYRNHTFTNGLSATTVTIRAAIQKANRAIESIAHSHRGSIPVVNLFALSDLGAGAGRFTLPGDNKVSLQKTQDANNPSNASSTDFFWSDEFHPTTIPQGLFANAFLTAMQEEYGSLDTAINLLSSGDILRVAGYSGSFTFDYSRYIQTAPDPNAAAGTLVLLGLVGLMLWRRRRRGFWRTGGGRR